MNQPKRILGKVVGHDLTAEEIKMVSGGLKAIICNGCTKSTATTSPEGYSGCQCD